EAAHVASPPDRTGGLFSEDEEARGIVRLVLDVLHLDRHSVELRRELARDRGRTRFLLGDLDRARGARSVDQLRMRQVALQPVTTLRQRLVLRIDAGDLLEWIRGDQRVRDLEV